MAPLLKTLQDDVVKPYKIYDPEGIIGSHKAFRTNGWMAQRRWGFDESVEATKCAVLLSQKGELPRDAEALFKQGKPIAVLIRESHYDTIVKDMQYLCGSEPDLVHIHTKTDNQLCWLLVGFNNPASNMIAVTPHHYVVGLIDNETYEAVSDRPQRGIAPPIFKLLNPEGRLRKMQCPLNAYEV